MVIMVYDTLQMHYSSPILTRLTYIITHVWMHYICMCMYIMAYMCIYTDIHVMDLFMYDGYINVFIYLYIYMLYFFCVCVCVCEHVCENESVVCKWVWNLSILLKKPPLSAFTPSPCSPTGPSVIFVFFADKFGIYLINPTLPFFLLKLSSTLQRLSLVKWGSLLSVFVRDKYCT